MISEITIVCNHRQLLAYELSNQRETCRLYRLLNRHRRSQHE
jgi:hypothetical protein